MTKFILFFIFNSISKVLLSQFNDSVQHYLKYDISAMMNKTNDGRSYVLNNGLTFNINKKKIELNSSNNWIYGRQNDVLINNDFNSVLNFDLLQNVQRLYYWSLASFTTSHSLKINYQFQAGAGIGFSVLNKENLELVVSDGIVYETSGLQITPAQQDINNTFRNSLRIKHKWSLNNFILLEGSHFWQPSLATISDYIIRSSSGISIRLKKWLSIATTVTYARLSSTKRENLLINLGLNAAIYF